MFRNLTRRLGRTASSPLLSGSGHSSMPTHDKFAYTFYI